MTTPVSRGPVPMAVLASCLVLAVAAGCSGDGPTRPASSRTYAMGFSWFPPRPDLALALQVIDLSASRSDWGLILTEPPWDSLLAGLPPDSLIRRNQLGLAQYYRAKGLAVVVSVDPTNGLDRASEAAALVAVGRSLAEPAIQRLYRDYVVAMDTLVRPEYLGVASETNLIRAIAPPSLYAAVRQVAGAAAADVHAVDADARLFSTVQVEVAWGRLVPAGSYVGIVQDRADFPFMQVLGLSSYPYLGGFADPDSVPLDYYSRLVDGAPLPLLVIEGGWPSDTAASIPSTPERQRRYIERHARILDRARAIGWFQITFTDLDLAFFPPAVEPFARLGLVTTALEPKPALAAWDTEFARRAPFRKRGRNAD